MLDSIFEAIYLVGLIVGSVIRRLCTRQYRRHRVTDDRETGLGKLLLILAAIGMIVIPLFYVLTPWLDFADYYLPTWAGVVGAVVFTAGVWLLWRSHADLGGNWSPYLEIREEHSLVTQGTFRHIRHPTYAAHWLWAIAQALLLQNWIAGLAMLASFLPLYLLRVGHEERMMLDHFGEEYRSYMNRTGRLIPRIGSECPPSAKSGRERTRG